MQIQFTKMHALGNDFIVIDGIHQDIHLTADQARYLANRHIGIGCDQILLLEKSQQSNIDFYYRIFNADGTEVAQCGNGARCLAYFIRDKHLSNKDKIVVSTHKTVMSLHIDANNIYTVEMGIPQFSPQQIPLLIEKQAPTYSLKLSTGEVTFAALSIGNPHAVLIVPEVEEARVEEIGVALAQHPFFPESVNVGFMQIINAQTIALRVFERGAGETLACGSGACAAVVAGRNLNILDGDVRVKMHGGELNVKWEGNQSSVFLSGSATKVFDGNVEFM